MTFQTNSASMSASMSVSDCLAELNRLIELVDSAVLTAAESLVAQCKKDVVDSKARLAKLHQQIKVDALESKLRQATRVAKKQLQELPLVIEAAKAQIAEAELFKLQHSIQCSEVQELSLATTIELSDSNDIIITSDLEEVVNEYYYSQPIELVTEESIDEQIKSLDEYDDIYNYSVDELKEEIEESKFWGNTSLKRLYQREAIKASFKSKPFLTKVIHMPLKYWF